MKILIDECLQKNLKSEFSGHVVKTAVEMKLDGKSNGKLLTAAVKAGFEVFVTVDKNLSFQQNIQSFKIVVIVLDSDSNELEPLKPIVKKVLSRLKSLKAGRLYVFE